ncbi:MAG: hypothetical protein SCK29_06280 [Bacillota bacterium]|nr:hypothetical protein [Bacillota bacterium]MDW7683715.1 hypothetical protein [Bacillota bacterium]
MRELLNVQLMEAREELRRKRKLLKDLQGTEDNLRQERNRYDRLTGQLHQEGRDVEKLEGLSVAGLFYSILGSKEMQLEKERQEYLAAKLQFDECKNAIFTLERDAAAFRQQLEPLAEAEKQYHALMKEKEETILAEEGEEARQLLDLSEKLADLKANGKELHEAIEAGHHVLSELDHVRRSLGSAKSWGTWDLLGGGLIATAVKHSRIDDARSAAHRVQQSLRAFLRELKDVDPAYTADITVEIGTFATFADYFFDGLIADWIVQSKINSSLDNAISLERTVETLLGELEGKLNIARAETEELLRQRNKLVEDM